MDVVVIVKLSFVEIMSYKYLYERHVMMETPMMQMDVVVHVL